MDIIGKLHNMLFKTVTSYPLLNANNGYNPMMRQRPLIDAGNTGRYVLDGFQVAQNSAVGTGTLFAGTFRHTGIGSPDVTSQHVVTMGGIGTIPQVPGTQGLVKGFRDNSL